MQPTKHESQPAPDAINLVSPHSLDGCKALLLQHDTVPESPGAEGARVLTGPIDGKTHWFTVEHLRREADGDLRVQATTKGRMQRTKINETLVKAVVSLPLRVTALIYGGGIGGGLVLMVLALLLGLDASLAGIIAAVIGASFIGYVEIRHLAPRREQYAQQVLAWLDEEVRRP